MDLGPFLADWGVPLSILVAVLGIVIPYRTRRRQRLDVSFPSVSLVAAPDDKIALGVTFNGIPVAQPVHLVRLNLVCSGNTDVALTTPNECVHIEAGEGVEFITPRILYPGKTAIEVLESTAKSLKLRFDLIKRSQSIDISLYVKGDRPIAADDLPTLFPVSVHIKDVRSRVMRNNRMERFGIVLQTVGIFVVIGALGADKLSPRRSISRLCGPERRLKSQVVFDWKSGVRDRKALNLSAPSKLFS